MKIVATVLVGPGTEHLIAGAINSTAGLADGVVLIDTRDPAVYSGQAAELRVGGASWDAKVVWQEHFAWCNDYAAARNAALGFAAMHGATHALTVDTDERLQVDAAVVRAAVEQHPDVDVFLLPDTSGYRKERIIKLATRPQWYAPTHEELTFDKDEPVTLYLLPGTFRELDKGDMKSPQNQAKARSHLQVLQRWIGENPQRAKTRWYRYMGESAFILGEVKLAHEYFFHAMTHPDGSNEEKAWCCIRGAECYGILGMHEQAINAGIAALIHHPGFIRDVAWVAAASFMSLHHYEQALRWAWNGINNEPTGRTGVVHPKALEGCWRIVMACAEAIGDGASVAMAKQNLGIQDAADDA